MKRKKRGLGWYFGMTFGDPLALADDDAPGLAPGGPRWIYVVMWLVIGLMLAFLPGLLIWRVFWVGPGPAPIYRGATDIFDGTYLGVEERLIRDRSVFRRCGGIPGSQVPGTLIISGGLAHMVGELTGGEVGADGSIRINTGLSLSSLHVDRQGRIQGQIETRYCTYHAVWMKQ